MSTTIGKFREEYRLLSEETNAFSTGVIVKSNKPVLSKSGEIVIWRFEIKDNSRGLTSCRMFLSPKDVIYVTDLLEKTVSVQGFLVDYHEFCHIKVTGLRVMDEED